MENIERSDSICSEDSLDSEAEKALHDILDKKVIHDKEDEFEESFVNQIFNVQNASQSTKPIVCITTAKEESKIDDHVKEKERSNVELTEDLNENNSVVVDDVQRVSSALSNGSHVSSMSSDKEWTSDPDKFNKKKQQSYEDAKVEWNQVEDITADGTKTAMRSQFIKYDDVMQHFSSVNLDEFSKQIKPTNKKSGFSLLWHRLTGPPKMKTNLIKSRDLLFTLGHTKFDNKDKVHVMILQTNYKKLTGTRLDCSRYGQHWIEIGFQGEDPVTDLRGCGMLGLINILYFITHEKASSLALDIYRLSQDDNQNFPFCVLAINITRITLQVLRDEKLNRECNNRDDVIGIFHDLYISIFDQFYHIWKTQNKTISDSGVVLQQLEQEARNKPLDMIKLYKQKEMKKYAIGSASHSKGDKSNSDTINAFSGICDMGDDQDGDNDDIEIV